MFKTFDVNVDITKEIRNQNIQVNSSDLQTLKFAFSITESGAPYDLTGATVRIAVKKPDKKTVFQDCTITDAETGKCDVVMNSQAYIVPGVHAAELMIYFAEDKVAVTGRFSYISVKGILNDESVESTNEFLAINQKLADVEGVITDLRENGTGIDAQARQELENVAAQMAQNEQQLTAANESISNVLTNETFNFGFDESGKMKSLYKDLINPWVFKLGLLLIGDSITWGMTTPDQASTAGRNGTYTDPKNVMTTKSCANLVHQYIAENFFKQTVQDGDTSTAGTIIYSKIYNLGFNKGYVTYSGEGTSNGQVNVVSQTNTLVGKLWYLYPTAWLEFQMTGDELELFYTATTGTPEYELFVDGVSQGKFASNNTVAANKLSRKHTFPYGTHTIRIAHGGVISQVRLEGIRVNKKFIFKNAGNIGRSSDDWQKGLANGLYDTAFSPHDRHAIIMLGTNDRTVDGWNEANSPDSTIKLLNNLVTDIQSDFPDMQVYIACANDVGEDESTKAFPMREVKDATATVAMLNNLPFIDHYSATRKFNKSKILADGLHPNEAGHLIMAKNVIGNLF